MKKILLVIACSLFLNIVPAAAYPILIHDTYIVQNGDTLDSITDIFIQKNTYGKREHNEFKSGIEELNEWILTEDIYAGAKLKINYWINDKEIGTKCQK